MNMSVRTTLPPSERDMPPRPRPQRAGPFGVLDIGTTKTTCLIGRVEADGQLRVLGFALQKSRGVRGGGIADLDEAERAVRTAIATAEDMADHRLRSVTVNLSCGQPDSRPFNVQWPIGGRVVSDTDVRRIVAESRSRALAEGREVVHALPLGFSVDDVAGVADPRGLFCDNLVARLHVIDAAASALRNVGATVARCDLDVSEMVSSPLAAGLSTLVDDERELGACVVDMGGGTTGLAAFGEGHVLHTAQLPVGGLHVTNDIARGLSTTVVHAERLKTLYGTTEASPDDERELLPVPLVGEDEHNITKVPRTRIVSIIKPRLEETFELLRDRLDGAGLGRTAGTRVVLTGGASQLVGVREMAGRILNRQVRLGRPMRVQGLPEMATGPGYSTAVGLLCWCAGDGRTMHDLDLAEEQPSGLLRRVVNFLRERV